MGQEGPEHFMTSARSLKRVIFSCLQFIHFYCSIFQSAGDMWTACVGQLTEDHQEALKKALEEES